MEHLNLLNISTVTCTRDANPCADVGRPKRIYVDQRERRQPVSHCRCGDPEPTNTTAASPTCQLAAFNVLPARHRHGDSLIVSPQFDFLPVYL